MKKVLVLAMSIALAFTMSSCGGSSPNSSSYHSSYSTQTSTNPTQKRIDVSRLRKGMSVNEVISILGQPESRQNFGGDITLYYPGDGSYGRYQIIFDGNGRYDHYNAY